MVVHPNKPVLFAVYHSKKEVASAIERFRHAIKGKKSLFIELRQKYVDQILRDGKYSWSEGVKAYQRLVVEADRSGLEIISLGNKKYFEDYLRLTEQKTALRKKISGRQPDKNKLRELEELKRKEIYGEYGKREKMWLQRLSGTNSRCIMVIAPGHGAEIANKLNLPDDNIAFPSPEKLRKAAKQKRGKREISNRVVEEIEKARLERAKRRAEQRVIRKARQRRRRA